MNTKTARQIEEMKKQTIGVEIEMNSISRSKAAKLASQFFGTGRYKNTADRNSYCTWSAYDEQGREWKFQKDVSIAGIDSEKCEMVTPILNYSDIETLQELVRILRKAGAKSDSTRGCGVHIHIGAKGHTAKTLRNLANIMASHEQLLISALNLDEVRIRRYCKTVDPRFWNRPTELSLKRCHNLPMYGTRAMMKTTAEVTITMEVDTICSTSTQPLQRERLNSDFFNLTSHQTANRTDFTQNS